MCFFFMCLRMLWFTAVCLWLCLQVCLCVNGGSCVLCVCTHVVFMRVFMSSTATSEHACEHTHTH